MPSYYRNGAASVRNPKHINQQPQNTLAPVALFAFNRPHLTRQVFNAIRSVRPEILLLITDGPRCSKEGEIELCTDVQKIIENPDWPCIVYKNFSKYNLGCKARLSTGLDWVFDIVEHAIILEDDCLPHPSFFRFCTEMLYKYEQSDRVMHIAGFNRLDQMYKIYESYLFSRFGSIWGWATWRRAWKYYDVKMLAWEKIKKNNEFDLLGETKEEIEWRQKLFESVYRGEIDTWDYQWTFARILKGGINIVSSVNLVTNIGFGESATHTKDLDDKKAKIIAKEISFPLIHPQVIVVQKEYDSLYLVDAINITSHTDFMPLRKTVTFMNRLLNRMSRLFKFKGCTDDQ